MEWRLVKKTREMESSTVILNMDQREKYPKRGIDCYQTCDIWGSGGYFVIKCIYSGTWDGWVGRGAVEVEMMREIICNHAP